MTELSYMKIKTMKDLLEEIFDGLMTSKTVSDVLASTSKWPGNWPNECKLEEERQIRQRLERLREEVELAFRDPYYREAYSHWSTPVLKAVYEFLKTNVEIKRQRQRRVTKRTVQKATKRFKFFAGGDQNLKSLPFLTNPEKIIGALACLVWIPKQRVAVWLTAKDNSGLAISNNNIVRFDPEKSFAKRVRKPEEMVMMLKESRKKFEAYLKGIKTQEYEIDGKMNKKYIIVKVW